MDRHARIDVFSTAAHRLAVAKRRAEPHRLAELLDVLARWRTVAGKPARSEPYLREWEAALRSGVAAVERIANDISDHGATLRSVSPVGRLITSAERLALLRQARATV